MNTASKTQLFENAVQSGTFFKTEYVIVVHGLAACGQVIGNFSKSMTSQRPNLSQFSSSEAAILLVSTKDRDL